MVSYGGRAVLGDSEEAPSWRYYYQYMRENTPFVIYYPTCGGGDECISACPYGDKIWETRPMRVKLLGLGKETIRYRPVMVHPELCKRCMLCVQACPTGALSPKEKEPRHHWLRLLIEALRLPFKKRYGIRYVFRKEHRERFVRNNWPKARHN